MNRLLPVAFAIAALSAPTAGLACGQASDRVIAERQQELDSFRKVKGTFRIIERIETPFVDYEGNPQVGVTLIGRIETPRGTGWNTIHSFQQDLIVMCTRFFQPQVEGAGVFFIERSAVPDESIPDAPDRTGNFYEMRHYDVDRFVPNWRTRGDQ
ncbi:hypothetical protein [Erythrobacter aurantius]|uniref:hypothetical protein n=1 Tax=Erythrobacter aurantius TaxID=2909249 RepID=UPI00207A2283|nr:hypothetical protein [Erythrobacter aurantius]